MVLLAYDANFRVVTDSNGRNVRIISLLITAETVGLSG